MSLISRLEALEQELLVTKKEFRLTDTYAEAIKIEKDNPDLVIFQMILNDCNGRVEYEKTHEPHESVRIYVASKTLSKFHQQDPDPNPKIPYIRGIFGPYGSGKSVGMVWEIMYSAYCQKPQKDGIKRLKVAIVRNTKPMLADTSLRTFQDWFGSEGYIDRRMRQMVIFEGIEIEVLFRALDKPRDIANLLSLEVSMMFLNECKEIPRFVWENAYGRTRRYPSKVQGGSVRGGLIFDSNFPSNVHYLYDLFEIERPIGHTLYKQPGGLHKEAENLENLEEGYYDTLGIGKRKEWVRVYRDAKYGFTMDGKPVHPDFESSVHAIPCKWLGGDLILGIDWGRTPCCAILQSVNNQWQMIDEIVTDGMGAKKFGEVVASHIKLKYPGAIVTGWGDPSGDYGTQADDNTPFIMFRLSGLNAAPAPGNNNITMRREALDTLLLTMASNHEPRFIVDPSCKSFIAGAAGEFKYRRLQVGGGQEKFSDVPEKSHPWSDIVEACEYGLLGGGAGFEAIKPRFATEIKVERYLE